MRLCNHLFFQKHLPANIFFFIFYFFFFYSANFSGAKNIETLAIFRKKNNSATLLENYNLLFLYPSFICHFPFFYYYKSFLDVNEHVIDFKACLNHFVCHFFLILLNNSSIL